MANMDMNVLGCLLAFSLLCCLEAGLKWVINNAAFLYEFNQRMKNEMYNCLSFCLVDLSGITTPGERLIGNRLR